MKTLRHIMRHGFLFTLQRDTTVADACRMMAAHKCRDRSDPRAVIDWLLMRGR